jgi:hypothetical protein
MAKEELHPWWRELRQNGMIISPVVLEEFIPEKVRPVEYYRIERLRNAFTAFSSWSQQEHCDDKTGLYKWLDVVLEDFLDYNNNMWQKHSSISDVFKVSASRRGGSALKPSRVLLNDGDVKQPRFLVSIDPESKRIGMGRGRNVYSSFLELLRGTSTPLGILTNGWQIRLIFTGTDYDCWVEWDVERWFEDAIGMDQLSGFFVLCGKNGTAPHDSYAFPLLAKIQESRTRQGELSQVLGEQTRRAVERLLKEVHEPINNSPELQLILAQDPTTRTVLSEEEQNKALYQATIRLIMRMVVSLFAEARELLPKENAVFYDSYCIEGLFAQLKKAKSVEGAEALDEQHQAWIRLLSLFRLIYEGSDLQDVPIPAYGGGLFRRGDPKSPDPVLRALALYEDEHIKISDTVILEVLSLLKIGKIRTGTGRKSSMVSGPVDFSDLRTEYIGMIYEGLLDYQLRKVRPDERAIIILNLGIQPALPFSLLDEMDDRQLKDLIQKLSKEKAEKKIESEDSAKEDDSDESQQEQEPAEEITSEDNDEQEPEVVEEIVSEGTDHYLEQKSVSVPAETSLKIYQWAEKAIKYIPKKKSKEKTKNKYQNNIDTKKRARNLIGDIILPGEMYLIRGSGTRKGTGTFYTKPQLAVPTVHRTLEPLVYDVEGKGEKRKLTPKTPETILSLKVCDPAMGSGSFLVAALRYLSDGLYESLWYHKKIRAQGNDSTIITLPAGTVANNTASEDSIRCPIDHENFEPMVKARLKRYMVERCIYGVDLNPLAVELGKLALWVETMDRELPFEFLDHKLKVGNSLIGCWFDNFTEYPVMAWMREGGDKGHNWNHCDPRILEKYYEVEKDKESQPNENKIRTGIWTRAIKTVFEERVKPELIRIIQGQKSIDWTYSNEDAVKLIFDKAVRRFERLHGMSIYGDSFDERETFFRDCIINDPEIQNLKTQFDLWCAIWYWHGDWMDEEAPTPEKFYKPTPKILERTRQLLNELKFFHWELEFADVFVSGKGGFDAVVGNPPWEISKPKSQEFFSTYDPIFRTRGKQEAIAAQKTLFTQESIEKNWLLYSAYFKAMSNWNKNAAFPFGDLADEVKGGTSVSLSRGKKNSNVHSIWRKLRENHQCFADVSHPFRHQGSADINTYKMFLEAAHALCHKSGQLGFIVPSGVYTDKGSTELRDLFITKCKWNWIWSFINWNKLFPAIYYRFKFAAVIVEKGNKSDIINCGFNKKTFESWENADREKLSIHSKLISRFSPKSKAILETSTEKDLAIIQKIYTNSILLGDESSNGWGIKYVREFDMTGDSKLFPPKDWWEERGYHPDSYGRWLPPEGGSPELIYREKRLGPNGDIALPLYEGRMIGQFDFSEKGYVSGRGRSANWPDIPWEKKQIKPQFLMAKTTYKEFGSEYSGLKPCFMSIGSATNMRSMIASLVPDKPCGNAVPILKPTHIPEISSALFSALLNSFTYDYAIRCRLGGMNLNYFVIEETPILCPKVSLEISNLLFFSFRLICVNQLFAPYWLILKSAKKEISKTIWKSLWAITPYERLRLRCNLDAIIAELYGLSYDDLAWILHDCAYPQSYINNVYHTLDPKGFWRVDQEKEPECRHTVLTLKAFADLKLMGFDAFCALNNGEGWMIPETLIYASNPDGTIAFDTLEGKTVPVRERLGPRFLDWQLAGTPEESWKECEMHAQNILGDEEFERMMADLKAGKEYRQDKERVAERVSGEGNKPTLGVAEVMKKAEKKREDIEKKEKTQKTLGEW